MTSLLRPETMTTRESAERRAILLHVAVAGPARVPDVARRLNRPESDVEQDLTALLDAGAINRDGDAVLAHEPASVVAEASPHELRGAHDRVISDLLREKTPSSEATLRALVDSGCVDEQLLGLLITSVHDGETGSRLLTALESLGHKLGHGPEAVQLMRAEHAARQGRADLVLSLTDGLLTSPDAATARQAALLAAAVHAQNDRLDRAAALYRHLTHDGIGDAAAWGVMASIGLGDTEQSLAWRHAMGETDLTNHAAGLADLAEGLLASVDGPGDRSLDLLARAAAALAPRGADAVMPDTPAALAAIVAMGRGEPSGAEVVLDRALMTGLGGAVGHRRHLLLSAWSCMAQGRLDDAVERINRIDNTDLLPSRDVLVLMGLRAGIARRRSDQSAARAAWRQIRAHTLGLSVDLYDLLPLSEIIVVAARLGDSHRTRSLLHDAMALLERLDNPPAWTAALHWAGLQAAFLSEDPAALVPHADALTRASAQSSYAAALAAAGEAWLGVVRGTATTHSIEQAAEGLVQVGHAWDASRLAGHAATRAPDRESALALLQLARRIGAGTERLRNSGGAEPSLLTDRELEVARLILDGQGYRAVGERLFISPKTVEHHVARIRRRLGAGSRAELLEMLRDLVESAETSGERR